MDSKLFKMSEMYINKYPTSVFARGVQSPTYQTGAPIGAMLVITHGILTGLAAISWQAVALGRGPL